MIAIYLSRQLGGEKGGRPSDGGRPKCSLLHLQVFDS